MSLFRYLIWFFILPFFLKAQSGSAFFNANDVFTVPPGVTTITVEVLGYGGRGGYNGGGGGGGGGFAKGVYTVIPNSTLQVTVNYIMSQLSTLIKATAGSNGSAGDVLLFTASGGQGGYGVGGTIKNSSGGNGGMGWPGVFGGAGGGAAGMNGNAQNGENAPAYNPYNPNLLVPVAKGGLSGGGVTSHGGDGGGYELVSGMSSYTVESPPTSGFGYGGGGGGAVPNRTPAYGMNGYCYITWGNNCSSVDPLPDLTVFNNYVCLGTSRKLTAAGYDTIEWYTDTLSFPFAKGSEIMSPTLDSTLNTFYIRTSGCADNRFVSYQVPTSMTQQVVPSFQYTTLCWGDVCSLVPANQVNHKWGPLPGQNAGFFSEYRHNYPLHHDSLVETYIVGYSGGSCTDTVKVQFYLRAKPQFTFTASPLHFCEGDTVTLSVNGPAISTYTWSNGSNNNSIKIVPEGHLPQKVEVTDSIGCSVIEYLQLDNRTPDIWIYVDPPRFCIGDSVLLTAVGAGSYTWNTGQVTNLIWTTPGLLSKFSVYGAAYGCASSRTVVLQALTCTDLQTETSNEPIGFYPNPTSGKLHTAFKDETVITVFGLDGKQIKKIPCKKGVGSIDLDLPQGMYFILSSDYPTQKIIVLDE